VVVLFGVVNGLFDDVELDSLAEAERTVLSYLTQTRRRPSRPHTRDRQLSRRSGATRGRRLSALHFPLG